MICQRIKALLAELTFFPKLRVWPRCKYCLIFTGTTSSPWHGNDLWISSKSPWGWHDKFHRAACRDCWTLHLEIRPGVTVIAWNEQEKAFYLTSQYNSTTSKQASSLCSDLSLCLLFCLHFWKTVVCHLALPQPLEALCGYEDVTSSLHCCLGLWRWQGLGAPIAQCVYAVG